MTQITRRRSLVLLASLSATVAGAERYYLDDEGLALRGYDPVIHFDGETAERGRKAHRLGLDGAIWQFARAETKRRFAETPERFQPEHGGFCAEGIARGFMRIGGPTLWVRVNGPVFLHYSVAAQNGWGRVSPAMSRWSARCGPACGR